MTSGMIFLFQFANTKDKPTCILAKTFKGQGFPGIANEMNWHGKALGAKADEVVAHLKTLISAVRKYWKLQ